jgi:nucleoid DNA-binding protein
MTVKFTRTNIQSLLRGFGLDITQAREATAQVIDGITAALISGEVIELRGLGTLEPGERKARTAHNPRTMAPVDVPARRVVFFHPAGKLKRAINEH